MRDERRPDVNGRPLRIPMRVQGRLQNFMELKMSMRDVVMAISALSLTIVGIYYGARFIRIKNYLLGWEWVILGFSASNMLLAAVFQNAFFEGVAMYCDAFSRGVGFPLIATLGFIELFTGRKFSKGFDVLLFVGGALFAWAARTIWIGSAGLEMTYVILLPIFSLLMLYFAYRLCAARIYGHGVAMLAVVGALIYISLLEGHFIVIPGEETNVLFNWLTLAMFVWAVAFTECFYAYHAYAKKAGLLGKHDNGLESGVRAVSF